MPDIICDDNHRYLIDGKYEVPSVTQVINGVFNIYAYLASLGWMHEKMERARKFGHDVHRVIYLYETGQPLVPEDPTKEYSPLILKPLEQWLWLKKHHNITVFASERRVYSRIYGYAGTLDIAARIGTSFSKQGVIIDIKTGAYDPTMKLQTGAYRQAANETYPKDKIEKRFVAQLTGEGYPSFHPHEDYSDISVFVSAIQIYNFKLRNKIK